MGTKSTWKQFETTGKVEDYLNYKSTVSQRPEAVAGCKSDYRGRETYAGIYQRDGNDPKAVSHGRI